MTAPRSMDAALTPGADPAWIISEDGRDPLRESSRESRFAISNGFVGVRGAEAINRPARWIVPPRTYVAGLFETFDPENPIPELAPVADWLAVRISLGGEPLARTAAHDVSARFILDMKRGLVLTDGRRSDAPESGASLRALRLVSLANRAIGMQLIQLEAGDEHLEVTLEAIVAGVNLGLVAERLEADLDIWRTERSGKSLAITAAVSLRIDGADLAPTMREPFNWSWTWTTRPGQIACFTRLVALTRGDTPELDPGPQARTELAAATRLGWEGVLAAHEGAWAERWKNSDVTVDGDVEAQQALRFALYHLNGAANPGDDRVSIGARALTGDDYHGHVFWDTEIFLLPFYTFTWPRAARALLMYRFRCLGGARVKARNLGWRGALYAWESADTGAEATPDQVIGPDRTVIDILCGRQEQHISADVAYAVWQYWRATADEAFMREAGAEILLETGRFWASRVQMEADGLGHIRGVIGPDEYHETIDDNAYTNVMARWNIARALDTAALLRDLWPKDWARLSASLGLAQAELEAWRKAAGVLVTGLDPATGLYEQFAGFFALEPIDLADYAGRTVPMDTVLGRDRIQKSQVVKQADVVALLALLPEAFPAGAGARNFDHYAPLCGHGSSLSRAMHGLAAARLGQTEKALAYFRETAAIDLADTHVAIAGGVHIAALGGVWMMAVFGFAGLALLEDGVALSPRMPAAWRGLAFAVQWRGRHLTISIDAVAGVLDVNLAGAPMNLMLWGSSNRIGQDQSVRIVIPGPGARDRARGASERKRDLGQA
jgi:trehalose/maltose hydrolase-like predicted phosphorylase